MYFIPFPMKLPAFALLTGGIVALGSAISAAAPIPPVVEAPPVIEVEKEETVKRWVLPNGNRVEATVLDALQERGITDKNALATILGNIKQESKFHPNICEGGHRVQYQHCHSGGYGLIQWTTAGRYDGLGSHAWQIGQSPSSATAQISYIFTEREWKYVEHHMKKEGHSIGFYMNKAYYWLGWGIHGARTNYAYNYADRLTLADIPVNK